MGVFEFPAFARGTKEAFDALTEATKKGTLSIIGGGDTAAAAEAMGFADKVFLFMSSPTLCAPSLVSITITYTTVLPRSSPTSPPVAVPPWSCSRAVFCPVLLPFLTERPSFKFLLCPSCG